jgi:hypothetical protein
MNRHLSRHDGYAIPIAMMVMSAMLIIALGAIAYADRETDSSRRERTHESRLNRAEGVMAAEIYKLSTQWPKAALTDCTETSASVDCPAATQVKAQFKGVDILKFNPTWDIRVRDNVQTVPPTMCNDPGRPQYYSDAQVLTQPAYDANGDCQLWVRASGTLEGKQRVIVAQVRVESRPIQPPAAPFVSGSFNTGNNSGNKIVVDTGGYNGVVRCDTDPSGHNDDCISYATGQISPVNMVKSDPTAGSALDPSLVDVLRQMAIKAGTYYATTCPATPDGDIVFVENASCSYAGNDPVNGVTKRGIFLINRGTLKITGGMQWWGVIYALNTQDCGQTGGGPCLTDSGQNDVVVELSGSPTLHGGIFVEGSGRLAIGASGNSGNCASCLPNLVYDPNVTLNITAYGTAGIIQNTWRELISG